MKKTLLTAVAALVALGASAQSTLLDNPSNKSYFGLRAGYNLSLPGKVKTQAGSAEYKYDMYGKGSGFSIGGVYNIPLVANLYVEPGVSLSYTTESIKHPELLHYAEFNGQDMKHSSMRKFAFEVPVQLGYHFDFTDDISLQVSTGPVLKVGLVNDYYLTAEDGTHRSGSVYGGDHSSFHRVDVAWRFGVGFNIDKHYYVGVSGDLGMAQMLNDTMMGTQSLHENAFQATVGYNF